MYLHHKFQHKEPKTKREILHKTAILHSIEPKRDCTKMKFRRHRSKESVSMDIHSNNNMQLDRKCKLYALHRDKRAHHL